MAPPTSAPEAPALRLRLDDAVPVLDIPEDLTYEQLRDLIRAEFPEAAATLAGRSVRLDLGARGVKLLDIRRLVHLLGDEFKTEVTGLYLRAPEIHRFAERELKLKLFPTHPASASPAPAPATQEPAPQASDLTPDEPTSEEVVAPEPEPPPIPLPVDDLVRGLEAPTDGGRRTLTVQRTVRSGTTVRFDGDVLVLGDVNPGAQIVASGSAVILGSCKGMIHVGATGDASATVIALDLEPTQLRIGRRIALVPEATSPSADGARSRLLAMFSPSADRSPEPRVARVVDDAIVIMPYRPNDPSARARAADSDPSTNRRT
jgi:septum site-determining protein MinC